ncbi:MAG: cell division protein FtsL [Arenicellales bacterium]|jgi:cell division protein FtsL|nr:cell division protein FtsL [Arenicellales bacterium]
MKWIAFLSLFTFISALAVVMVRHQNRVEFREVRVAEKLRDRLNDEWGRLQLEQATWSRHNLVEQAARQELGMVTPEPTDIVVVQLEAAR